jgi:hypothetical protein
MKVRYARNDDIVTVRFGTLFYAVAEARELKAAGFGARQARKGCLEEWTLVARSRRDFERLIRYIPEEMVINGNGD